MKISKLFGKLSVIFLTILFSSVSLLSQTSGWINKPSGTTSTLYAIHFNSVNTGFVAGSSGIIRTTTDGGDYWYPLYSGTTATLYDIYFANSSTGWTIGSSGVIRRSTNGGMNWTGQSSGTIWSLYSCHFVNSSTGWISGYGGTILKTTNSGVNWVVQISGTYDDLNSIFFISENTGWCTGYGGIILGTTNGGTNWENYYTLGTTLNTIRFATPLIGWVAGNSGAILKTTDGGNNWETETSGTSNAFYGIFFLPTLTMSYNGWAVGNGGTIKFTSNAGMNWVSQYSYSTLQLRDVFFINLTTGWITGASGIILKSTTGGLVLIENISGEVPDKNYLFQNYPNPFNPSTKIKFDIPLNKVEDSPVRGGQRSVFTTLKVFDITGRELQTLVNENLKPGTYEVTFDAGNLPGGVYLYRLNTGNFSENKKMLLVK